MTLDALLARTEPVEPPPGLVLPCRLWLGALNSAGYPVVKIGGVCMLVTRVVLTLAAGPIPRSKLACHACDRSRCIEPTHLEAGTHSKNLRDAWHRKRRCRPYLPVTL